MTKRSKRGYRPGDTWDHTVHEERKAEKARKDARKETDKLMAQVYEALDVDPDDMYYDSYELKNGQGTTVWQVKVPKGTKIGSATPTIVGESGPETIIFK